MEICTLFAAVKVVGNNWNIPVNILNIPFIVNSKLMMKPVKLSRHP